MSTPDRSPLERLIEQWELREASWRALAVNHYAYGKVDALHQCREELRALPAPDGWSYDLDAAPKNMPLLVAIHLVGDPTRWFESRAWRGTHGWSDSDGVMSPARWRVYAWTRLPPAPEPPTTPGETR